MIISHCVSEIISIKRWPPVFHFVFYYFSRKWFLEGSLCTIRLQWRWSQEKKKKKKKKKGKDDYYSSKFQMHVLSVLAWSRPSQIRDIFFFHFIVLVCACSNRWRCVGVKFRRNRRFICEAARYRSISGIIGRVILAILLCAAHNQLRASRLPGSTTLLCYYYTQNQSKVSTLPTYVHTDVRRYLYIYIYIYIYT